MTQKTCKLDDIVDKYNNTYHSTIKIKPIDVKSSTCIDFKVENYDKDPKFEIGDHRRISKYNNITLQFGQKKLLLLKS